ncbi:LOW QUALITY PROTEIN: hypothetical protein Dda_5868 [Drechslerella dactyloides]|uniref:Uncharacterized protein n=1 Tax=Drechslerella dactyloides TaxID=74499 RepID=A0AAD6IUU4_DREDA|nr:LOW QUALITY PROTEIN: hypothetical protein Dda_5868 [Drechslerella dactyloides]
MRDCFLACLAVLFPPIAGEPPDDRPSPSPVPSPTDRTDQLHFSYQLRSNSNIFRPAFWVKRGVCSADSVINIALCCLGYVPGLLHAWYIIAKYPDPYTYSYEPLEGGQQRVYYYTATYPSVAAHAQPVYPAPQGQQQQPQGSNSNQSGPQTYGTTPAAPSPRPANVETAAVEGSPKTTPQPQGGMPVADGMSHGASSSAGPSQAPPSYSDVVKGDYKVQTH